VLNSVALSIVSIYVPAYLLSLGYSLEKVIIYYTLAPIFGLTLGLFFYVPLMKRFGLVNVFKFYYPLKIVELILLFLLAYQRIPLEIVALIYGAANYAYWMPLNLLFVRHSAQNEMSSNLAKFYALPQLFSFIGPLIGAILVPFIGFLPVFVVTVLGLLISFIPLAKISNSELTVSLNFIKAWTKISKNKSLFLFEFFDNVLEESNWFWGIYVFIIIGSLSTPGIVGSLTALGGAIFTFIVGKYSKRHDKEIIPLATILLMIVFALMIIVKAPIYAYLLTLILSFIFTLFIVSYFSVIYKTIKGESEEEFIILREIPTLLGRLVIFAAIYLTISNLKYFFLVPLFFTFILLLFYIWKKKHLYSTQ
jgi:MFS family permease